MALEQLALPLITISDIFGKLLSISKDQSTTAADDDDCDDDEDVFCMIVSICRGPTRLNSTIALLSLIMASPNCIATLQSTVYVRTYLCDTLKYYVLIILHCKVQENIGRIANAVCQSKS